MVLGFGNWEDPCWEKFPNNPVFFFSAFLISAFSKEKVGGRHGSVRQRVHKPKRVDSRDRTILEALAQT